MVPKWRIPFNTDFDPDAYPAFLADLDRRAGTHVEFRVAETPCFFTRTLLDELAATGTELTRQLLGNRDYLAASLQVIPPAYRLPSTSAHPHFMTADFGMVRLEDGSLAPRLVELQAFPSVFAFQALLGDVYRDHFDIDPSLSSYLGGHTEESFWKLLRKVVVGNHDPSEVVLAEIRPEQQKTYPDFLLTSRRLGIPIVDATQIVATRSGSRTQLFYREGGQPDGLLKPIRRIYNRVIVDELIQKGITLPFDYRDDLDVEWAGHPNWYFQISKFSIPFLQHPAVPEAVFLDDWFRGGGSAALHQDREQILLKPLFSFAGKGIVFAPSDTELRAIPEDRRQEYLVQQRVHFEPVIETPFGPTQAEIRILYAWPDSHSEQDSERAIAGMQPVISLVRLGRGKMMGVDHNRDQQWVGASAAYSV